MLERDQGQGEGERLMISLRQIVDFVDHIPSGVWMALTVLNVMMTIGTWSTTRRRMRWAGERVADPQLVSGTARAKDTALTVASMIPAALFWAMVLAGSFHCLIIRNLEPDATVVVLSGRTLHRPGLDCT